MSAIRFGIVGTGFIAGVIAHALANAKGAALGAVSSRKLANAEKFVAELDDVAALDSWEALVSASDLNAVYVATPTVVKEEIALAAIAHHKHVLVDKPFGDQRSVARMIDAAQKAGVVFMDATHFVHHPRTAVLKAGIAERIGKARSLHTTFYFPFSERTNIRFDPRLEPMGAVGDMGWYSMRAMIEYLQPTGTLIDISAVAERDPNTGSAIRAGGFVAFSDGSYSTFDVGYTAGTVAMDLHLLGTEGIIEMDDFVLDWTNSFAFHNSDIPTGFTFKTGSASRNDVQFVNTPSERGQDVAMIERFVALATGASHQHLAFAQASADTQRYVDAVWASVTGRS